MKIKRLTPVLLGLTVSATQAFSSSEPAETSDTSALSGYLTEKEAQTAKTSLAKAKKADKPKNKMAVVLTMPEVEEQVTKHVSEKLRKLVKEFDDKDNQVFQYQIKDIQVDAKAKLMSLLAQAGMADRSDEEVENDLAKMWRNIMNAPYVENQEKTAAELRSDALMQAEGSEPVVRKTKTYNTTLLNMLLRRKGAIELAQKVRTMIENGADKNLNEKIHGTSLTMENQKEFPIKIAIDEITDGNIRAEILAVLTDDKKAKYEYNDKLEADQQIQPVFKSLEKDRNYDWVLKQLLGRKDFPTFNVVLTYLEKNSTFVTIKYEDKLAGVKDEIKVPVLEEILKRMLKVRKDAMSTRDGKRKDNIMEFFASDQIQGRMSKDNHDARFDQYFRNSLLKDFKPFFKQIADKIDDTQGGRGHKDTELKGKDFQALAIQWAEWAEFRNRMCNHLNLYALTASGEAKKSNVVKLTRYVNIGKESSGVKGEANEIFNELTVLDGKEIIFTKTNEYGWTPLMYAMTQKQSEGLQIYLSQAPAEIKNSDGLNMNILHLAFPLPLDMYKGEGEENKGQEDVFQMISAEIGNPDAMEKTRQSVAAVMVVPEETISVADKVDALKAKSANNFTPVALAAAMGFVDVYEDLEKWLLEKDAWNRDDHSYLAKHIEELLIEGIGRYVEKASKLTEAEKARLLAKRDERQAQLNKYLEESKDAVIYNAEDEKARDMLDGIMGPAVKVLEEYKKKTGKDRNTAPYKAAFEAAFKQLTNPDDKVWEEEEWQNVPTVEPKLVWVPEETEAPKKTYGDTARELLGMDPKKKKVEVKGEFKMRNVAGTKREKVKIQKRQASPLKCMKNARSPIKISYLRKVTELITAEYLEQHKSEDMFNFKAVYAAMTTNQTLNYFKGKFNATIEKEMQKVIRDVLEKTGKLEKEPEPVKVEDTNGFNFKARLDTDDDLGQAEEEPAAEQNEEDKPL